MIVTGTTAPLSSKSCVMPTFLPKIPRILPPGTVGRSHTEPVNRIIPYEPASLEVDSIQLSATVLQFSFSELHPTGD
jgi:hypothetical protein